jgi:hypothetical protein
MKRSSSLALVEDTGGEVRFDVVSASRLEGFDHGEFDAERVHGFDYLFDIAVKSGRSRQGWQHIQVRATAPGRDPEFDRSVRRFLDLRSGGDERRLFEALSKQDQVSVSWVNEGATAVYAIPVEHQGWWREVLENTGDLGPEDWRREYDWLLAYGYRAREFPFHRRRAPRHIRRMAEPPDRPVPFFAARSGAVPRAGRPTVAGVRLPSGERNPDYAQAYWVSDEPIEQAGQVAGKLTEVFSETGVWPLLWNSPEDLADYEPETGDLDAIDGVDVERVLRRCWDRVAGKNAAAIAPFGERFPGLAPGNPGRPAVEDPFGVAGLGTVTARLLLVPCNRPADAVTVLGGLARETDAAEISAVFRSWEERFNCAAVAVEPGLATVAVLSPPKSMDDALLLAAEYWAFCPPPEGGNPDTVKRLAAVMIGAGSSADQLTVDRQGAVWLVAPR